MNLMKRFFFIAIITSLPTLALAHLMPAGQGTINIVGNLAYVAISVPQKALQDREHQNLEDEEKASLKKSLIDLFKINPSLESQGAQASWKEVFVSVPESSAEAHAHHRHEEIIFTAIAVFKDVPQEIHLVSKLRLPAKSPIEVMAAISENGEIILKERQQLSNTQPQLDFFKERAGGLKALHHQGLNLLNTAWDRYAPKSKDKTRL